jgi:hypothetical protein
MLKLTQQVFHHNGTWFVTVIGQSLKTINKTWPWAGLQFVE